MTSEARASNTRASAAEKLRVRGAATTAAGWIILTVAAAALRFYRPFTTLDLGASLRGDTPATRVF